MSNDQLADAAETESRIVPFWHRLPSFFLFPLSPSNLIVLLALALASLLHRFIPVPQAFAILIAEGIIWLTALRHSFRIMELASHGYLDAASQNSGQLADPERKNLPWKMIGIFFIWTLIIGGIQSVNSTLGGLASFCFSLTMPAIIMTLSESNSLTASINPAGWWRYIYGVGKPYVVLCLFLFLLLSGPPMALRLLSPLLGGTLTLPIVNFVALYFNLIMFFMMGYVMYQFHESLDLGVMVAMEDTVAATRTNAGKFDDDALIAHKLAVGEVGEAIELAESIVRNEPENLGANERLLKLLVATGNKEKAQQHANRFFARLMRLGHHHRGYTLYKETRVLGGQITLAAEHALPLAEAAAKGRETALAVELVRGFDKRYPGHADIPPVYFFSARLASEQLRKDEVARSLLRSLIQRYPDHQLVAEASRYLEVLDRMTVGKP